MILTMLTTTLYLKSHVILNTELGTAVHMRDKRNRFRFRLLTIFSSSFSSHGLQLLMFQHGSTVRHTIFSRTSLGPISSLLEEASLV